MRSYLEPQSPQNHRVVILEHIHPYVEQLEPWGDHLNNIFETLTIRDESSRFKSKILPLKQ